MARTALSVLTLALLCVAFHWRLLFTDQYSYLASPDLANMELPRYQFIASEIRHLRFPLWDPYLWCGQPFLAQFTGAAYPLNWIVPPLRFDAGKVSVTVMHWYYALIHFQAAAFAFWLCRDLGRSHAASTLGGLVFALAAFFGTTDWPQLLNGAVWGPLILMFLLRSARGHRPAASAALSGLCLGMAWLSGHHEVPLYLSLAAAALWAWQIARAPRMVGPAALSLVVAALTSGLQTIPGLEYARHARRWAGLADPVGWSQTIPYTIAEQFSFTPASLAGIVVAGVFEHVNPFVGVAAFSLALLGGILYWRRDPRVAACAMLAVGAVLFAMASSSWMHGLIYSTVPFAAVARVPARAMALFSLGAAPLVAWGFDAVREEPASPWVRRFYLGLFALAGIGFAGAVAFSLAENATARSPLLIAATASLLFAAILAAWRAGAISPRALAVASVLVCLWEIGSVTGSRMPNLAAPPGSSPLAKLRENDDIASFLRAQPQPVRAWINEADIPSNFGDWQSIETPAGFMAGVTSNLLDTHTHYPRIQDLLAVNYAVSRDRTRPEQEKVFTGASGIGVWRNPNAFPRVRIVHRAERVPSRPHLRKLYEDPGLDLRTSTALLEDTPALEWCEGGSATIATRLASRVEIRATLACRGMVILADTYYPGWTATVDGAPARVWEADGALRGVVVDRGSHDIVFAFRPTRVYAGAAMSAAGVAAAAGLWLFRGRREVVS
jgi:hypothetical protein